MKFFALIPLVLSLSTSALAGGLTKKSHSHDVIQARQAKLKRHGGLVDICASLDLDLVLPQVIRNGNAVNVGRLDVSLCVSSVLEFVKTSKITQLAVMLLSEEEVTEIITKIIKTNSKSVTCTFPEHAKSACGKDDLCAFECKDGYQLYTSPLDNKPSDCVCPAPMSECNGVCGNFPNGCGSATPQRRNTRRANSQIPSCPHGVTVCGVPGSEKGWECVDTRNNKESCGACVTPSPFGISTEILGQNCKSVPNVDVVDCHIGKCVVHTCKPGFSVTPNKDGCAPIDSSAVPVKRNISDELTQNNNFINLKNLQKTGEGAGLKYVSV